MRCSTSGDTIRNHPFHHPIGFHGFCEREKTILFPRSLFSSPLLKSEFAKQYQKNTGWIMGRLHYSGTHLTETAFEQLLHILHMPSGSERTFINHVFHTLPQN
jgi:hypothetical protein